VVTSKFRGAGIWDGTTLYCNWPLTAGLTGSSSITVGGSGGRDFVSGELLLPLL
jgi:hypothetical protein